ncbi:MAG TPA: hypothetical protein VGL58_03595 [Caulobacteraceae bacterium]|jgi:hypothetical protein
MGHRRSVATIKVIAGGEHDPITCFCGADTFEHTWTHFPMRHVSKCVACGLSSTVELKVTPPRPSPAPPQSYPSFDDGGAWY